ncbi:MAG TPA: hypothetical protein VFV17_02675 [Usitatibacteraceae bacterium]|nr:hypothetical protein [Usitatibacteraceae bacterium]
MNALRTFAICTAVTAALFGVATSATATTFGTDTSDLWWDPSESGWGVTATQQNEVVFLTFFVYGADNRPTWYIGQTSYTGNSPSGEAVFEGTMYQTTGPWLGTTFNPSAVGTRAVGSVKLFAFVDSATLFYNVDGVFVTKQITRQTFRINNLNFQFTGVLVQNATGCANGTNNGTTENPLSIAIQNSTSAFSMATNSGQMVCNYVGDYVQSGRMGSSRGTYSCPGISGNYNMFEIEANPSGITARIATSDNLCSQYTGRFAGVRR